MKDLYLIGAGGFCIEVLFLIDRFYKDNWKNIFVIDDNTDVIGTTVRGCEVISNINDFVQNCKKTKEVADIVLTINNPSIRKEIVDRLLKENLSINFPNIIDDTLIFDEEYSTIGNGNIIMDYVSITGNVSIGDFNIIGGRTGIGHDAKIGDFNTFFPRVSVSGGVEMGNQNIFGLNSSILQNKKMGNNNDIWSYTIILKNVKDNCTYFGIPAKKIQI